MDLAVAFQGDSSKQRVLEKLLEDGADTDSELGSFQGVRLGQDCLAEAERGAMT